MHIIRTVATTVALAGLLAGSWAGVAAAHVVVSPDKVTTAGFETFTVSVPNESETANNTKVRLVMPGGLKYVKPTVKLGWTIEAPKAGSGEDATVREIIWSGGTIPPGQRDEFSFSAQVPADETTLQWRAYQLFDDGTVNSWDRPPSPDAADNVKPYSETSVVEELDDEQAAASSTDKAGQRSTATTNAALVFSVAAILLAVFTLLQMRGGTRRK